MKRLFIATLVRSEAPTRRRGARARALPLLERCKRKSALRHAARTRTATTVAAGSRKCSPRTTEGFFFGTHRSPNTRTPARHATQKYLLSRALETRHTCISPSAVSGS